MDDRLPPQAIIIEQQLLCSIMENVRLADEAIDRISENEFYSTANKLVFGAIKKLRNDNINTDFTSIEHYLAESGNIDKIGGAGYLSEIYNKAGSCDITHFCNILREKHIRREIIIASNRIISSAFDPDIEDIDMVAEQEIYNAVKRKGSNQIVTVESAMPQLAGIISQSGEKELVGIPTGFTQAVDIKTGGLANGDTVLVAGRPSSGKTAFSLATVLNAAEKGFKIVFFSLETTIPVLLKRMACIEAKVNMMHIKLGILTGDEHGRLQEAMSKISKLPIFIDCSRSITMPEIRSKCRSLKNREGIHLAVIDYVQIIKKPQYIKSYDEYSVVSENSNLISDTSKELDIPIIALSQLSRDSAKRNAVNHRPTLGDLRGSGSLEQNADIVIFVHREEKFSEFVKENKREEFIEKWKGKANIIIAKQKDGDTSDTVINFDKGCVRFNEENFNEDF